ncbi:MAG: molecular chaperone TorD family protein [Proteobacteria bacterium]|nr:molecular chaperone TorD family protein [Pseudomonadota bacterium]
MAGSGHAGGVERPSELARTAKDRSLLYGFLANVFGRQPTLTFLRHVRAPRMRAALLEANVHLDDDFLSGEEVPVLLDLTAEYTRLFTGPGRRVPPYASFHVPAADEPPTRSVAHEIDAFVQGCGFPAKRRFNDLPDHIGALLRLMARVVGLEAKAWQAADPASAGRILKTECDFVEGLVGRGMSGFCAKVVTETESSFYQQVARLTAVFIRSERNEVRRRRRYLARPSPTADCGPASLKCARRMRRPVDASS